jgi:large subunit ribosomal protein L25
MATSQIEVNAVPREVGSRSLNSAVRNSGRIPAVIYGDGKPATPISLPEHEFMMMLKHHQAENLMMNLNLGGQAPRRVMLKELQSHPITARLVHVDFHEVSPERRVKVKLSLHLSGIPKGVEAGGTLDVHLRTVVVECVSKDMLEVLDVDISQMDVGDHLLVKSIVLPAGFRMVSHGNVSVATVLKARVAAEAEDAAKPAADAAAAAPAAGAPAAAAPAAKAGAKPAGK